MKALFKAILNYVRTLIFQTNNRKQGSAVTSLRLKNSFFCFTSTVLFRDLLSLFYLTRLAGRINLVELRKICTFFLQLTKVNMICQSHMNARSFSHLVGLLFFVVKDRLFFPQKYFSQVINGSFFYQRGIRLFYTPIELLVCLLHDFRIVRDRTSLMLLQTDVIAQKRVFYWLVFHHGVLVES